MSTPSNPLCQYMTEAWAALAQFTRWFSDLTDQDVVWDPCTGTGNCLAAVPAHVPAFGSEICPRYAAVARARTGRPVITGDLRTIPLPERITAIYTNPPFRARLIESLLERSWPLMPEGSKCGLILPAAFIQTSSTVVRLNAKWTITQEALPRDLFNRPKQMRHPLIFALFQRDSFPRLIGFSLYHETRAIRDLPAESQRLLADSNEGPQSVWFVAVATVVRSLGGRARLVSIYAAIEGNRPTRNPWWKQQVRKVCQHRLHRVSRGTYELPQAA